MWYQPALRRASAGSVVESKLSGTHKLKRTTRVYASQENIRHQPEEKARSLDENSAPLVNEGRHMHVLVHSVAQ